MSLKARYQVHPRTKRGRFMLSDEELDLQELQGDLNLYKLKAIALDSQPALKALERIKQLLDLEAD